MATGERIHALCSNEKLHCFDMVSVITDTCIKTISESCIMIHQFLCFCLQVASELNAAILEMENRESTPKLANLLKLLLWSQEQLDSKKVKYPKMSDLAKGEIEDVK